MRAWVLRALGGPASYQLEDIPRPEPGPDEVRVGVRAAGLNHLDLWVSRGKPAPPLPHVPGADGAGVVTAVGERVEGGVAVGDEVVINPGISCGACELCRSGDPVLCERFSVLGEHRWGTLAEEVVVPARNILARPPSLTWIEAAAYGTVISTALRMLERARLQTGETMLVSGASGGVGTAGLLVGQALGARVFVTARRPDALNRAIELGAHAGFLNDRPFADAVREATEGRGVDVVFEHLGAAVWDEAMRSLARGGRLVTTGATTGPEVSLQVPQLFWRHLEVIGSTLAGPDTFARATDLVASGAVPVLVDEVIGFNDLHQGLDALASGGRFGKIVVDVAGRADSEA